MQVKVRVFESYAIRDGFIFPLGSYIEKTLDKKAIKKALVKFVEIKNEEDVLNFAKEYGLLNPYETRFFFEDRTQEQPTVDVYEAQEGLLAGYTLISIPWRADLTVSGIHSPVVLRYEDDMRTMTIFPSSEWININLLGGGNPWPDHLKQPNIPSRWFIEYYRNRKTTDFIYMFGEYLGFSEDSTEKPILSWAGYVQIIRKRAENFLNLILDEKNRIPKETRVKEHLLDETFEANVTIRFQVAKKKKVKEGDWPFEVKTELVFKNLIQAFTGLIFTKGMVKLCVRCGTLFIPKSDKAKYCSPSCKTQYLRKKQAKGG